jgi:hypothetical protein
MQADAKRNLHHESSTAQAFSVRPDAARSVLVLGTTAPAAKPLGNPEWVADLEYVWRSRTTRELARLGGRARAMRRAAADVERMRIEYGRQDILLPVMKVQALRSAEWAEARARALALSREQVVNTCDERWRSVACGCKRYEFRVGCDQPQLCARCRKRHAAKWWRRIASGMDAALRDERRCWYNTPSHRRRGMLPGIYLITLTAPHSGDMVADRERVGCAVRKLLKHANKRDWWRTYALTWEATSGDDGLGHVHVHLAVISSWVPYTTANVDEVQPRRKGERRKARRGLHEVWMDAVPGAIQPDVSPPNRARNEAQSAGYYLAKYVTKGIDPDEFTGRKAGELLCAFRSRRKVSTSAGFWQRATPHCESCQQPYRLTGAPCSLQDIAPGAVLASMSERTRYRDVSRFEMQVALRSGDDTPLV